MTDYPATLGLYIDGEWLSGGGRDTHRLLNPATGAGQADLPLATAADLDRALDAAERGFARMARGRARSARRDPQQGGGADPRARRPYRARRDDGAGQAARRGEGRSARVAPG